MYEFNIHLENPNLFRMNNIAKIDFNNNHLEEESVIQDKQ